MSKNGIEFLARLEQVIGTRKQAAGDTSYTATLFAAGASRIAQKVGEEAVELALASVAHDRSRTISEAADLLYHTLVLLSFHNLSLADVVAELERRHR